MAHRIEFFQTKVNYQADLLSELYELFDIEKSKTTPYHRQCDGQSERGNK
jgi:hypothetical protein